MKVKYAIGALIVVFSFVIANIASVVTQAQVLKSLEEDIGILVESIKPSLVTVQTKRIMPLPPGSYKGTYRKEEIMGAAPVLIGSGIVYDKDGYILTTASVIGGKERFTVTLPDGREVEGRLVGTDPDYKLAVLKVDAKGLTPARLGNSDVLKAGSWLTIVGNSYGMPSAVALGLMNGKREDGFLQMSADVSPGNSGGPVLNTKGEVIGLVSAKVTERSFIGNIEIMRFWEESRGVSISPGQLDLPTSGVSLAIPMNDEVKEKTRQIVKHGTIRRGYLGVYINNLNEKELKEREIESGVMVERVEKDSPADKAGLVDGDVIASYDDKKVESAEQLSRAIKKTPPQTQVNVGISRDGKMKNLKVTLGESESKNIDPFSIFLGQEGLEEYSPPAEKYRNRDWQGYIEGWGSGSNKYQQKLAEELKELQKRMGELEKKLKEIEKQ